MPNPNDQPVKPVPAQSSMTYPNGINPISQEQVAKIATELDAVLAQKPIPLQPPKNTDAEVAAERAKNKPNKLGFGVVDNKGLVEVDLNAPVDDQKRFESGHSRDLQERNRWALGLVAQALWDDFNRTTMGRLNITICNQTQKLHLLGKGQLIQYEYIPGVYANPSTEEQLFQVLTLMFGPFLEEWRTEHLSHREAAEAVLNFSQFSDMENAKPALDWTKIKAKHPSKYATAAEVKKALDDKLSAQGIRGHRHTGVIHDQMGDGSWAPTEPITISGPVPDTVVQGKEVFIPAGPAPIRGPKISDIPIGEPGIMDHVNPAASVPLTSEQWQYVKDNAASPENPNGIHISTMPNNTPNCNTCGTKTVISGFQYKCLNCGDVWYPKLPDEASAKIPMSNLDGPGWKPLDLTDPEQLAKVRGELLEKEVLIDSQARHIHTSPKSADLIISLKKGGTIRTFTSDRAVDEIVDAVMNVTINSNPITVDDISQMIGPMFLINRVIAALKDRQINPHSEENMKRLERNLDRRRNIVDPEKAFGNDPAKWPAMPVIVRPLYDVQHFVESQDFTSARWGHLTPPLPPKSEELASGEMEVNMTSQALRDGRYAIIQRALTMLEHKVIGYQSVRPEHRPCNIRIVQDDAKLTIRLKMRIPGSERLVNHDLTFFEAVHAELSKEELTGRALRELVNIVTGRNLSNVQFYHFMGAMEDDGIVVHENRDEVVNGETISVRWFKLAKK